MVASKQRSAKLQADDAMPQSVEEVSLHALLVRGDLNQIRKEAERRLNLNPKDIEALLALSEANHLSGDLKKAISLADTALLTDPTNQACLLQRAELALAQSDSKLARELCERLASKDELSAAAIKLVNKILGPGRAGKASAAAMLAAAREKGSVTAWLSAARNLLRIPDVQATLVCLENARALGHVTLTTETMRAHCGRIGGDATMLAGAVRTVHDMDPAVAIQFYTHLVRLGDGETVADLLISNADNPDIEAQRDGVLTEMRRAAGKALQAGNTLVAARLLRAALRLDPDDGLSTRRLNGIRANVLRAMRETPENADAAKVAPEVDRAVAAFGDEPKIVRECALSCEKIEHWDRAAELWVSSARLGLEPERAYKRAARAVGKGADPIMALRLLEAIAAAGHLDEAGARRRDAALRQIEKQLMAGVSSGEIAATFAPARAIAARKSPRSEKLIQHWEAAVFRQVSSLVKEGRIDAAAELVGPAMLDVSGFTRPLELVAAEFVKHKQYDRAAPLLREILRLKPQNAIAWLNFGRCLIRQKDLRGAAEALTSCLTLEPDNANAKAVLATVNVRLGRAANSIH